MSKQEIYLRIISDIGERLKQIAKQYEETGDADAMHLGIMQILYGRGYKEKGLGPPKER
ncbi:hypothetical protein MKY95_23315 [Paenibacillus sp. FSL P4-0176]|uniref:hypothetical protein n=1 Tax=Paenibacillus sp. FSL P4-0176 TaxID=2921631 RepID=UPI0030D1B948